MEEPKIEEIPFKDTEESLEESLDKYAKQQDHFYKEEYPKLIKQIEENTPLPEDSDIYPIISAKELLEKDFPTEQWLIEKFLPSEGITMLVGEAGTLKSYLALGIVRHLLSQEPFLGHFQVLQIAKVLFIDKENKLRRLKRRMQGLKFPLNDDVFFLEYPETFTFEDTNYMNYLRKFIAEYEINVVILDSFIDMFSGNENSSTDTAQAINAIRSLSHTATFLVLHHDSKPMPHTQRTPGQKTRGSSNIIAQVDAQFYFTKGKDTKTLLIEQGKSRDEEPLKKFIVNIISDEEGQICDFQYQGEFKSDIKMIEECVEWTYNYIKLSPMISKESLVEAGKSEEFTPRTIQDALATIKKKNLIESIRKPGRGNQMFYFPLVMEEGDDDVSDE